MKPRRMLVEIAALYLRHFPFDIAKWRLWKWAKPASKQLGPLLPPRVISTKHRFRMLIDPNDHLGREMFLWGEYEPECSRVFCAVLKRGDHVLDIGANIGYFPLLGASLVGKTGEVIAFEASPITFQHLKRNVALNQVKWIKLYCRAVGKSHDHLMLYQGPFDHSGVTALRPIENSSASFKVEVVSLNEQIESLPKIDLVKIDAEGAEFDVLSGMLEVLSRLYWATQKDEYLQMAERIAEVYFFEILPNNQYLPGRSWNFATGEPESSDFVLLDHGSEIIAGLVELYLLEKMQGRSQAARYHEPLKTFLDLILVVGRTDDGLWYRTVDIKTHEPLNKGIVDTWGYILNAYQMFDIVEDTSIYADEINRTIRAAVARKSFAWGGGVEGVYSHDGYADSIESMLYLLPWFDKPEYHHWVDDEIGVMFRMQSPSGFIGKGYLDGNFIRTSLLYATYKTQGIMVDPWREDVYLGAAYDRQEKNLYIYLSAEAQWKGVLKFDPPRHSTIWNFPFEYPRLNGTPEWFVVDPQKMYAVVDLNTGKESFLPGQSLAKGLAITLDEKGGPLSLRVSED